MSNVVDVNQGKEKEIKTETFFIMIMSKTIMSDSYLLKPSKKKYKKKEGNPHG
jgi:hypothetical protein